MTKEALKLALEALESIKNDPFKFDLKYDISKAITAIKEALAQPEQEPVAFEKTVCPFCTSEWVTAEQHDRNVDRVEQEPVEVFLTDEHQMGFKVGVQSFILDYWPDEQAELEFMKAQLLTAFARAKAQRKPLTDEEIDKLSRTMVKGNKSVNWLCRAIEAAHGIKEQL